MILIYSLFIYYSFSLTRLIKKVGLFIRVLDVVIDDVLCLFNCWAAAIFCDWIDVTKNFVDENSIRLELDDSFNRLRLLLLLLILLIDWFLLEFIGTVFITLLFVNAIVGVDARIRFEIESCLINGVEEEFCVIWNVFKGLMDLKLVTLFLDSDVVVSESLVLSIFYLFSKLIMLFLFNI